MVYLKYGIAISSSRFSPFVAAGTDRPDLKAAGPDPAPGGAGPPTGKPAA